jgi:hypothetical protein
MLRDRKRERNPSQRFRLTYGGAFESEAIVERDREALMSRLHSSSIRICQTCEVRACVEWGSCRLKGLQIERFEQSYASPPQLA